MYGVWIAPLFIMGTLWAGHRQNPRKGWKEGKGKKIEDQEVQRISSISSKSSSSMFMIVIWSFLASSMSLMKGSLHLSSGWIGQYSTWKASAGRRSLMLALLVFNRMFLRFDPVVDLASCWIEFKRCFDECLLDFWICSRNLRNLLMKTRQFPQKTWRVKSRTQGEWDAYFYTKKVWTFYLCITYDSS